MGNFLRKLMLLLAVCAMHSQTCRADWFKGRVVNAETGEALVKASVTGEVNPHPGWSISRTAETDSTGCFTVWSSYEGRIMFTASMIGYKNFRKVDYAYGSEVNDTTDIGTISLRPTALMLQEVEVKAKLPRITMSGDTIVFNPEAFNLKDGARLDELIRKLPGVYRRDGKLYWNGKPIRLMMNGKDIFGGDQIVGQLPAEVAGKLKLYDRKSELAHHTGKGDGEEDHVLDIQVKPGFLDKWYGNIEARYVPGKRYKVAAVASRLSDHDPQMVYAQANNINERIERTMRNMMTSNIDGDGRSQYGSYNYQHNWHTKGTDSYSNNNFDISATLGHSDGWNTINKTTETFFPGKDHTFSMSGDYRYSHKLTPQLQANLFAYTDSLNSVTVKARAMYEKERQNTDSRAASYGYENDKFRYHTLDAAFAAKPGDALYGHLVTRNRNRSTADKQARGLAVDYSWTRYLGKKGSFSLSGNTTAKGDDDDMHTARNLEYLRDGVAETQWQYSSRFCHDVNTSLGASFDYWLGKKVYVNVADNAAYSRSRTARCLYSDTDSRLVQDDVPTTIDTDNCLDNVMHTWENKFTLKTTVTPVKDFMLMPKFDWTMRRENADYTYGRLDTAAVRTSHAFTPSVFLKWKMSRVRNMDLSFAYDTTVPDITSTFSYRDTSDPMWISTGNDGLHNSHSHTTTFGYHRMWLRKQIVLGLSASYRKDINPVAQLYKYNSATGVYESKPVNVKGGDRWDFGINYDHGMGAYFRLMNKLRLVAAQSYGFLTLIDDEGGTPALNRQKSLGITDDLAFSFETEKLQLTLFNNLDWNRYRYDDATYNTRPLYNSLGVSARLKLAPFEFSFRISDDFRSGYKTADMNGHRPMATAGVDYSFCKNKCRLSLWVDDIFNKDVTFDSDYSAYQRTDTSYTYLHHYVALAFRYRFDAKGSKRK